MEDERKDLIKKGDHPERKGDEAYIGNISPGEYYKILCSTRRPGLTAYDSMGEKIGSFPEIFPVFVKKGEGKKVFKNIILETLPYLDNVNPLINKEELKSKALKMKIGDSFTFTPGEGVDNWMSREVTEGEINHEMWQKTLNREVSVFPVKDDGSIIKITCHKVTSLK